MSDVPMLPLTATVLAIVGLSASPAVFASLKQWRNRTPKDNFYEDVDGKSTPESVAAYSSRRPKTLIIAFSVVGFATSIALSVLSTLNQPTHYGLVENLLTTASWVSLALSVVIPKLENWRGS